MSTESRVRELATAIGQDIKLLLAAVAGRAPLVHASRHATAGDDPIFPADIGAAAAGHSHGATAPAAHATSHGVAGSDPVTPAAIGAMPTLTATAVKTADYTAVAGDLVLVAPSVLQTVTLPAAVVGARVGVKRTTAGTGTINTRIQPAGTDTITNSTISPVWVRLQDETAVLHCWTAGQWVVEFHGVSSGSLNGYAVLASEARVTADQVAGTASIRTLGTGAQQAAAGNDSRITGAQQASAKGQANGYAGLDSGAKVPIAQLPVGGVSGLAQLDTGGLLPQSVLPAIALTEFLGAVASQAAMLALTGQRGDWCTRTDLGVDYQLIAEPSSTLASWRAMTYPASPVSSVNGRTGPVTGLAEASDVTTALAGKLDSSAAPELIRDTMGTALVAGGGATVTPNDAGDTISVAVAYGSAAGTAAQGNDARLSDARTPTAHASSHGPNGSDSIAALYIARALLTAKGGIPVAQSGSVVGQLGVGTDGQVLTADAAATLGVKWAAAAGGVSQAYVDRQTLSTVTATKTAAYTAVAGELVMVDATAGPITITLPAQSGGGPVAVKKLDSSANAVTITRAGTDTIGTQAATTTTIVTQYQIVEFRPSATAGNWAISGGQLSVVGLDARYRTPPRAISTAGGALNVDGVAAGNVNLTCTGDPTVTVTGVPTFDRMLIIECLASGGARTPAIVATVPMVGVTSRSIPTASGKVSMFGLRYSTLRGLWLLVSTGPEA